MVAATAKETKTEEEETEKQQYWTRGRGTLEWCGEEFLWVFGFWYWKEVIFKREKLLFCRAESPLYKDAERAGLLF